MKREREESFKTVVMTKKERIRARNDYLIIKVLRKDYKQPDDKKKK